LLEEQKEKFAQQLKNAVNPLKIIHLYKVQKLHLKVQKLHFWSFRCMDN